MGFSDMVFSVKGWAQSSWCKVERMSPMWQVNGIGPAVDVDEKPIRDKRVMEVSKMERVTVPFNQIECAGIAWMARHDVQY